MSGARLMAERKDGLHWLGDEVAGRVLAASSVAIDRTMHRCVAHAQRLTAVRTGALRASIGVIKPARQLKRGATGRWGSPAPYAVKQEFQPAGTPYLLPAADHEYPGLAEDFRRAFERKH